jgi:hypothetical protein
LGIVIVPLVILFGDAKGNGEWRSGELPEVAETYGECEEIASPVVVRGKPFRVAGGANAGDRRCVAERDRHARVAAVMGASKFEFNEIACVNEDSAFVRHGYIATENAGCEQGGCQMARGRQRN